MIKLIKKLSDKKYDVLVLDADFWSELITNKDGDIVDKYVFGSFTKLRLSCKKYISCNAKLNLITSEVYLWIGDSEVVLCTDKITPHIEHLSQVTFKEVK